MGWGRGRRMGLRGRGGRGRRGVCIGCMLLWEHGATISFLSSFWDQHGLMVYHSLEAITLRTLRSPLNRLERIHKDGQSL